MARRPRTLYEFVEPDDLTSDRQPELPGAAAETSGPEDRRKPRLGAGLALAAAVAVLGFLAMHSRSAAPPPPALAPVARAARQGTAPRAHHPHRQPTKRARPLPRRARMSHTHARGRSRARAARSGATAALVSVVARTPVAGVSPQSAPLVPARSRNTVRSRSSGAEREFGFER